MELLSFQRWSWREKGLNSKQVKRIPLREGEVGLLQPTPKSARWGGVPNTFWSMLRRFRSNLWNSLQSEYTEPIEAPEKLQSLLRSRCWIPDVPQVPEETLECQNSSTTSGVNQRANKSLRSTSEPTPEQVSEVLEETPECVGKNIEDQNDMVYIRGFQGEYMLGIIFFWNDMLVEWDVYRNVPR